MILFKIILFFHNKSGDIMEKRIVYIAYLIIAFVVFDFFYGFTDWIAKWQMWNWYLIILLLTIAILLLIKYKQNQRKLALDEYSKQNERRRLQLSQLVLFEQLEQLSETSFSQLLKLFYELKGYESVEIVSNPITLGYDLCMWSQGEKIIVKSFKCTPLIKDLYTDSEGIEMSAGELVGIADVRHILGAMKDYNVQADQAIIITTSDFDEEAKEFAKRNQIQLLSGDEFYREIEVLRESGNHLVFNMREIEV